MKWFRANGALLLVGLGLVLLGIAGWELCRYFQGEDTDITTRNILAIAGGLCFVPFLVQTMIQRRQALLRKRLRKFNAWLHASSDEAAEHVLHHS